MQCKDLPQGRPFEISSKVDNLSHNVVYIAGPMSGIENHNRSTFMDAESRLKAAGYVVLNPAILPTNLPEDAYMPICIAMINQVDMVALLPGWADSRGAKIEYLYSLLQKKHVADLKDFLQVGGTHNGNVK